jgi:hypothetical protein
MNHRRHGSTVAEVYELFLDWKYGENAAKQLSSDSRAATEAAFELLRPYHSRLLDDVTIQEWQDRVNKIGKQYSRSTVRNVVGLIKNLYGYAVPRELCRKDFGRYVVMPKTKPEVIESAKDNFGNELRVGDEVYYATSYCCGRGYAIEKGRITGFTPCTVIVSKDGSDSHYIASDKIGKI